jgi:cyclopropane-fatty-acyl-phospholipid synthase
MGALSSKLGRIYSAFSGLANAMFGQTRSQARLNAIASYDQSNELFKVMLPIVLSAYTLTHNHAQAFLSHEMMYSCALWGPEEGGVNGDLKGGPTPGDLEAAQRRKIRLVLEKARVRPGYRILEFGSGWGGLAIEVCYVVSKRYEKWTN